jgi:hypothetical protein
MIVVGDHTALLAQAAIRTHRTGASESVDADRLVLVEPF